MNWGGRWALLGAGLFLAAAVVYPVTMLLLESLWPGLSRGEVGGFGEAYRRIFQTPELGRMLRQSVYWAGGATLGAWVLGGAIGYLLGRTNVVGRRWIRLSCLTPIMTPPYVLALTYVVLMQRQGLADRFLWELPPAVRDGFFSLGGLILLMSLSTFGYVALGVEAALRGSTGRLEQIAATLGAGPVRRWCWITLPLLMPALLNTGLIVFLDTISNFGVAAVMGSRAGVRLLPDEIYQQVTSWPSNIPLATALAALLLVLSVVVVAASRLLVRWEAGGRGRVAEPVRLPAWGQALAWVGVGAVFALSTLVPYAAMLLTSLVQRWDSGMPELTLRFYGQLFSPGTRGFASLWTSLWLSLLAASLCVVVGGAIAYLVHRHRSVWTGAFDSLVMFPRVLPKIVMAVGLILAWNAPWMPDTIYRGVGILLVAYVVLYFSDAVRFGSAGMQQIPRRLEDAARVLGAKGPRVARSVVAPLLAPSLRAAWLAVFIVCMRDLVASVILLPPGVSTSGAFIFNEFEQGGIAIAMAMATVTILLTTAVLLLVQSRG